MHLRPATVPDADGIATVQVRAWQAAYAGIVASTTLEAMSVPARAQRWREQLPTGADPTSTQALPAGAASTWVSCDTTGAIAGFISFGRRRDAGAAVDDGEIWALYVAPDAWRGGHGRRLLGQALSALRAQGLGDVHLWVLAENRRGIDFYRAAGFVERPGSRQAFDLSGQSITELGMVHRPVR
jgi:ribosomal protein S18 acetylase RimI-like enzyme